MTQHDLPLVIRYEPVQLEGRWGVCQRVVRFGETGRATCHFRSTEEEARDLAEAMQFASDQANEEWREAAAKLDAERQKWKDTAEREAVASGVQTVLTSAIREVGLKIRLSRSIAPNEVWVSNRDVDLATRLSKSLGVAPEPA